MSRRPAAPDSTVQPTPLAIPAPGLSFAQRLLLTGASPDLLLQAQQMGMLDGQDLNAVVDGKPLIQHWVEKSKMGTPAVDEAFLCDTPAQLDWPVAQDPTQIKLRQQHGWTGQSLWWEHAAIALIQVGVDPTAVWEHKHYTNLIDWAHENNRPWLLDAGLQTLSEDRRHREVHNPIVETDDYSEAENHTSRLHEAMKNPAPLLAQVWFKHGANLHLQDSYGETPIFKAGSSETLGWALSVGARAGDLNHSGQLPLEAWRQHVQEAEEWGAMQALAGSDKEQTLALVRSAVAKGDVEGFQKAYELLDDQAALMDNGRTVLGYVAEQALKGNDNTGRTRNWRVDVCKMIRHLWTRTDFTAAQSQRLDTHVLNDLQLAWVAGQMMEKSARSAGQRALAKIDFTPPSHTQMLQWAQAQMNPEEETPRHRPLTIFRDWLGRDAAYQITCGKMGAEDVLGFMTLLHATQHRQATSYSIGCIEGNIWAPLYARVRDGLTPMTDEQIDQAFSEVLGGACWAVQVVDGRDTSTRKLVDYRQEVRDLDPGSQFNASSLAPLAISVLAWSMLGGKPTVEAYPQLCEAMRESGIASHPDFEPLEPVWAAMHERALDERLGQAKPGKKAGLRF